jgi:pyridoxine 4-dehydrogenase
MVGPQFLLILCSRWLGTWSWGNQFLWGYSEKDDEELQKVFNYVVSK